MVDMRERIKKIAKEHKAKVRDFLALTPGNDPMYIQPAQREKGKWFQDIWEKEGRPEIHPRGLHYRILGKGYETRKGEEYVNSLKCWNEMVQGAKWARILGLVPFRPIQDEQNPDPDKTSFFFEHDSFKPMKVMPDTDLEGTEDPDMTEDDTEKLIGKATDQIVEEHFGPVEYNVARVQPNYIEVWSEKSAVIPENVCREAGATIRPAGGGEMSVRMCWDAVRNAERREKPLHIFLLVDFDPKGMDMPKSVARKIETEAHRQGVEAYVHHVAVTKEQCEEYALPTTPAREPEGTGSGAKAYKTHTQLFENYAGQEPTEINSFQGREPDEYRRTLRDAMLPYFDPDLSEKVRDAVQDARDTVRQQVKAEYDSIEPDILDVRRKIKPKLRELKRFKENQGLPELIEKYENLLDIDTEELLSDVEVELPDPELEDVDKEPLLDTERGYGEQIRHYKNFDIRYK